jgi:catecholate siderophore receptor
MSLIKSRKRPVGAVVVSLSVAGLVRAADSAPPPEPQVMQGVSVRAEVETESYKAESASSPKFTQSLLNTPQTISVIKKELLRDQGASTLSEALRNSPGITFTLGENGNTTTGDSVFMRGFDTSGSIFVDGVRDLGTISRDVFNTEQVEIVKGPSGSDNGRTSPTGYLNLASKVPTLAALNAGSLTGGTEGKGRFTLDMNRGLPIGASGAAVRFNAMYDKADKLGRDVAEGERWGFAPSLALGLGSETRAYVNYLFVKQRNLPDGGIPAIGFPGYANVLLGAIVAERVDVSNFYGSLDDYDNVKANMLTVRLEHDLSAKTTLRNVSRYGRTTQDYVLTGVNAIVLPVATIGNPATWTVTRTRQGKDQVNEILTNQTSLVTNFATGRIAHDLSTGIEILYERQSNVGFTTAGAASLANLYNPSTVDVFARVVPSGAFTDGSTMTAAAYAFDTLHFGAKWLLTAGLRFERYKTEFTSLPASTVTPQTATLLSAGDGLLSGKLGLVFKPQENGSIYVAVANSQQPPGGSNFTLNAGTPNVTTGVVNINAPNLDPQKAVNFEVGTKWDLLDNLLVLTAAAFDTTNKNDQATRDPVTGEVDQYGEKKVRGLEFGVAGMIKPDWQVSAGISLLDTEVTQGATSSPQQSGAQINFSPRFSFTSWTTYRFPVGVTIGGGARYVTSQSTQINNGSVAITNLPEIPSYWVVDAMAAYEISQKMSLQLNATNIADKLYLASVNNGRSRYALGAPRAAQLTLNFSF